MRPSVIPAFLAFLALSVLLSACASPWRATAPLPQHMPRLQASGQWYQVQRLDQPDYPVTLLAVQQQEQAIRFVQTDALGAPVARQVLDRQGWQQDGFVMPNMQARALFAALLPALSGQAASHLYPGLHQQHNSQSGLCQLPDGLPLPPPAGAWQPGVLLRQQGRDLWCLRQQQGGPDGAAAGAWLLTLADRSRWLVRPLAPAQHLGAHDISGTSETSGAQAAGTPAAGNSRHHAATPRMPHRPADRIQSLHPLADPAAQTA